MNLIVTLEYRFKRTPDGQVWTQMSFQYSFWKRYLEVFDNVVVVARILDVDSVEEDHHLVSGDNIITQALPYYHGPLEFFKKKSLIKKALYNILRKYPNEAVIMRVGSPIADLLQPRLVTENRPYGLEVVGDPWEVFRPGTFNNPLRPLMRGYFTWKLKNQCRKSMALSYVTQNSLQARYPGAQGCFTIGASTIELKDEHIAKQSRVYEDDFYKFIYVGTLEQLQKAPDVLIKAAAILYKSHQNFEVNIIGDGKCRPMLENLAKDLGISKVIKFHGLIPAGDPIRELLDSSDIFVLPSRGEGLPRAMIEAMARALPCIGSDIGGINELIEKENIVEVGSAISLARKMQEFISDPKALERKSLRNLKESKQYLAPILKERRTSFYKHIETITKKWNNEK